MSNKLKYFNYFFNFLLFLSLIFVAYVILDADTVNIMIDGKSSYIVIWLFSLAFIFVLKEIFDYWFVNRSKTNFIKVALEVIGMVFFTYVLIGAI